MDVLFWPLCTVGSKYFEIFVEIVAAEIYCSFLGGAWGSQASVIIINNEECVLISQISILKILCSYCYI
jgi:hypothetical protein